MKHVLLFTATLCAVAFLSCSVQLTFADNACSTGGDACEPYAAGSSCTSGGRMKLRLVADVSKPNENKMLKDKTIIVNNTNETQHQVSWGFCPQVDQLQAFEMINSSAWVAGDIADEKMDTSANDTTKKFLRIYGAVGLHDDDLVPPTTYDSSAMIYDPALPKCGSTGNGRLIASFLVINFTLNNGAYRLLPSFAESVRVGFMPTCDANGCIMDETQTCIGPAGRKNCAVCIETFKQLKRTPIQVFASYYGTDTNGRRLESGASNPLNFRALAAGGALNKLQDDVKKAAGSVKDTAQSTASTVTGG